MNDIPDLESFIAAATQFRDLAEAEGPADETDLPAIRSLLLRLLFHIPAIRKAPHDPEADGTRVDDLAFHRVRKRFSSLPFNYYRTVFDPHDLDATDEPVMAILSDDLSDIYRDLAEGFTLYDLGNLPAACATWWESYRIHWARHAVEALAAIDIHLTQQRGGPA